MINFSFNIRNPFSDRWETFGNPSWQISRNKFIELQFVRGNDILGLAFRFTTRQDHAGVFVSASLLGHEVMFHFYDTRHWNHEAGRYYAYDAAGQAH
jgi:hypothetical protein